MEVAMKDNQSGLAEQGFGAHCFLERSYPQLSIRTSSDNELDHTAQALKERRSLARWYVYSTAVC